MNSQAIKQFNAYIKQNFSGILSISPIDSTTPFEVQHALTGNKEFIFLSKCSPYLYAPVKGRDMQKKSKINFTMYNEGENLIIRFEILDDMILESEIGGSQANAFLSILLHQETITLIVVDAHTNNVVWLTNTIPFKTIRFHFKEIFQLYGVL